MKVADYMAKVVELGCIICQLPAELHHPRLAVGLSQKSSDWLVIPLCPDHHRNGGHGTAIHAGKALFEQNHGTEPQLLALTIRRVKL